MAKYRLRIAHELETVPMPALQDDGTVKMETQRIWLPGDVAIGGAETEGTGTVVGDGTRYVVKWPTLEMIPLDAEAEAMIEKEKERLMINDATMNPVDDLLIDNYEERYIPGSDKPRRPPLPHGSPVAKRA